MTIDDGGRIAIVGGGVIGCAVAAALAPDRDVVLLEADRIAGGATGRSAGLVTIDPAFSDARPIAERAMAAFERLDADGEVPFHEVPSLEPVPADEEGMARRRVRRLRSADVSVRWLDRETVVEQYPLAIEGAAGALVFDRAGWVDPHVLTTAYRRSATDRGADVEVGTAVRGIVVEDGAVTAVETDTGTRPVDAVVVAANYATPRLVDAFVDLPVRAYRTQCVRIEGAAALGECPMSWDPSADCYFRPDGDGLLVGGYPAFVDDPDAASRDEDAAFRRHVADVLDDRLDVAGALRLADGWAGVDLATPDGRPIVDALPDGPAGLVVATGFHGRGVMTAPVVGSIVRDRLGVASTDLPTGPFDLDRLASEAGVVRVPGIEDRNDDPAGDG